MWLSVGTLQRAPCGSLLSSVLEYTAEIQCRECTACLSVFQPDPGPPYQCLCVLCMNKKLKCMVL